MAEIKVNAAMGAVRRACARELSTEPAEPINDDNPGGNVSTTVEHVGHEIDRFPPQEMRTLNITVDIIGHSMRGSFDEYHQDIQTS